MRPLRIGIINIMPQAESYEANLLRPLTAAPLPVDPVWLRLESHAYSSSDRTRIESTYQTFAAAQRQGRLDGLILTGAPVEELAYVDVRYWPELSEILTVARREVGGTLGLCWGGMALAKLLGIEKRALPRKLFGVFAHENRALDHPIGAAQDDVFWCAHSRHSGLVEDDVAAACARGAARVLAAGPEAGSTLLESGDGRFLMHIGHPEYEASRLLHEWRRDRELGRIDVDPPLNLDLATPATTWRAHRNALFARWLAVVAERRSL